MRTLGRLVCLGAALGCDPGASKGTAPDTDTDGGDPRPDTADSAVPGDPCGDAVVDEGEDCDLGVENALGANCLPDCTWNPVQAYVASAAEVFATQPADARGVEDATAPAGRGAWGTSATDLDGSGLVKFELYFDPTYAGFSFLGDLTLGQIRSIRYHTRKPDPQTALDFYLVLYTRADGVDDEGLFYGYRLTALPSQARALDAPADVWNTWSTDEGPNQLTFVDEPALGSFTAAGLPTLQELTASPVFDWSSQVQGAAPTAIDYASERVRFISLQTGSGSQTRDFEGLLDLVEIELTDGRRVTVDLEP